MRGITLLCLVGFILTASWPKGSMVPLTMLPRGSTIPMENENGTNTTTNSSMVLKDVYIVQLNGTREVVDNTDGFPPPPDGKDTQPTPAKRIQTTRRPISIWNPLDNDSGFKKPTPQALGIWNPLDNDSGFPREPAA
ncbi:hypothetical protein PFLUV_G00257570 [Perca fluviatilis]|uniref:Uncharacterized protein n=1 Tax=Perca fluviatilis TaxID=8168 RepID=A0A6A5DPE7_PERFL|nr:hypothetical protein PFLUV_G00257570 [Perca fluviatilis]